ncbi:replication restart helicase PriA [Desulfonatronum lacustre]|uniref:replication restart helicase PriA n=1 Tax=Desulfonatronum lacustre TaxID=66849 RepID=UPI000490B99C|nr:primosomal protein N' [Desulfonatronum lacustre]
MTQAWNVALCSPPYLVFTYAMPDCLPPEAWAAGQRVMVPVGKRTRMGVIMEPSAVEDGGRTLKPMIWPLDQELLLTDAVLDLVRHLARRQMVPEGLVLSSILPKALRSGQPRFRLVDGSATRRWTLEEMSRLRAEESARLGQAWMEGRLCLEQNQRKGNDDVLYTLLRDPPWGLRPKAKRQQAVLEHLFAHGSASLSGIARGVAVVQDQSLFADHGPDGALVQCAGETDQIPVRDAFSVRETKQGLKRVMADLVRKGLVQAVPVLSAQKTDWEAEWEADGQAHKPTRALSDAARGLSQSSPDVLSGTSDVPSLECHPLSDEQADALGALEADLRLTLEPVPEDVRSPDGSPRQVRVRLVHGVTGSGKTLLYLRLARAALAQGRSVLLLAPEVALSAQLWSEVNQFFPQTPRHWYHGSLPAGTRLGVFRALRHQATPQIVVGTRSALFLPFANLGLIVVDEEHDASYKQDEGFTYQAKEVAYFRIKQQGGLLLLGSATPDIKTFHAADQSEINSVTLRHRVSRKPLPEIQLVDMRPEPRSAPLSQLCRSELEGALQRGEQAMFLLNRRGFAPLVSCLDCGTAPKCPRCEVGLTYHKGWERLLCHYCGFAQPFPFGCGQCGGTRFLPLGEGTEGLEEYLENLGDSGLGIVRLDRDSTRRKGSLDQILKAFSQGRAQVMVGTQMLSKGHHFPGVTLVVAVDGDVGLNLPDYRAAEKTFQLLVQLAGRAGRGDRPGRVLIQTRNPDHPCWEHIRTGNYEGFFAQELERRRKFAYPPFVKLAMIRLSYPREWEEGAALVATAGDHLRREGTRLGLRVLGPAPAPLGLLNGRKRFQCLLKAMSWQNLREAFTAMRSTLPGSSPLRVTLDLDPVNML